MADLVLLGGQSCILTGGKKCEGRKATAKKTEKGLNGTEGRGLDGTEGRKVENIETPIFVPFTKESRLKKRLQEVDRLIGEATGTPACRFVERCGGSTIVGLLCRNNPWALQWECGRKECLVCKGRQLLAEEEEQRQIAPADGPQVPRPAREAVKAVPKCTMEGAGYLLECWT